MNSKYEVFRLVDGHLFDAECYERTSALGVALEGESGYYLALRPPAARMWRGDSGANFVGPFETAESARLIVCEAEPPKVAAEDMSTG